MITASYIHATEDGTVLDLLVQPNARKTEVTGEQQERLKIRVACPPVEGKANTALRKYLSKTFGISRSKVTLISGDSSRLKRVLLKQVDSDSVSDTLRSLIGK